MAQRVLKKSAPNTGTDLATHMDTRKDDRQDPNIKISDLSNTEEFDSGLQSTITHDSPNYQRKQLEGGESVVPPSLRKNEASLAREVIRNVLLQPVDDQTPSLAAMDKNSPTASLPSTSNLGHSSNSYVKLINNTLIESPSAKPSTLTLTRDVPETSDEPLAAVDVAPTSFPASIHANFSSKNHKNPTSVSFFHQTPSSIAVEQKKSQTAISSRPDNPAHSNNNNDCSTKLTSYSSYDSPSARPPTLTLTRDVPEHSDEPLAAVDVVPYNDSASILKHLTPACCRDPTSLFLHA